MATRLDERFTEADERLAASREAELDLQREELDAEADARFERLKASRAEDAATCPSRTEADDLDELEQELRASARAAVFSNGTWAVQMAEAADAIAFLRGRMS